MAACAVATPLHLAPSLAPTAAAADDDARARFLEAQRLFDEGKYDDALPVFRGLVTETDSPNARLYVARCLRELSRLPEAYEEMARTASDAAKRAEREPKYVQTRDSAAAELVLLERRVARISVAVDSAPEGAVVRVNGEELPVARWGKPLAVNVGRVRVSAEAPGRPAMEHVLELAGGANEAVALTFGPSGALLRRSGGLTELAKAGLGVGLAGLGLVGAGAGFAGAAVARFGELDAACGGARCVGSAYVPAIDEGRTLQLVGNVGLIGGGAVAATGFAMLIAGLVEGPRSTAGAEQTARAWVPWVMVSGERGFVGVHGAF